MWAIQYFSYGDVEFVSQEKHSYTSIAAILIITQFGESDLVVHKNSYYQED